MIMLCSEGQDPINLKRRDNMGYTLIFDYLVQSSISAAMLVFLILLVKKFTRNSLGARGHYWIWMLLVVKLMIPLSPKSPFSIFNISHLAKNYIPINTSINKDSRGEVEQQLNNELTNHLNTNDVNMDVEEIGFTQNKDRKSTPDYSTNYLNTFKNATIQKTLINLWILGFVLYILNILMKELRFYHTVKNCMELHDPVVTKVLEDCIEKMSLKRKIKIVICEEVIFPSVYGITNPVIMFPINLKKLVQQEDIKYIILHELAHIKRMDTLMSVIIMILRGIYWFNPIVHYAFKQMEQDKEIACDALAMTYINSQERRRYGEIILNLLVKTMRSKSNSNSIAIEAVLKKNSKVKRRISMIGIFNKKTYSLSFMTCIVIGIVALLGLTRSNNSNSVFANYAKDVENERKIIFKDERLALSISEGLKNSTDHATGFYEADLKKIKRLTVEDAKDLEGIEYCTNLEELTLTSFHADNLNHIGSLKNLTHLSIKGYGSLKVDTSFLMHLDKLMDLKLENIGSDSSLREIAELRNLQLLYLKNINLEDFSLLSTMTDLKVIELDRMVGMTYADLDAFKSLKNLKKLTIRSANLRNLNSIEALRNIEELTLEGTRLRDISGLESLDNLRYLSLKLNQIENVDALGRLKKLEYLDLDKNFIRDISPLSSLGSLKELYLNINEIEDVSSLGMLEKLQFLGLKHNNISDISSLVNLNNLQALELKGNVIKIFGSMPTHKIID